MCGFMQHEWERLLNVEGETCPKAWEREHGSAPSLTRPRERCEFTGPTSNAPTPMAPQTHARSHTNFFLPRPPPAAGVPLRDRLAAPLRWLKVRTVAGGPQQGNGYDCGLFVLCTVE